MTENRRAFRVLWIVFALALFNLGDLLMTLEYRHINLMVEDNSLAASLVYNPSPWPLIIYKVSFVALALTIFIQLRRKLLVEIVTALLLVMFVCLIVVWYGYMDAINDLVATSPSDNLERAIQKMQQED